MTTYYSVLVAIDDEEATATIASDLVNAIVAGARSVFGVTGVSINQLVPGDTLQEATTP
jgi:hypothetical protein